MRVFPVLIRQDLEGVGLQIVDLKPNSSQFVPAYEPAPQSGYISFCPQNDTIAYTVAGGVDTMTAAYKGLAAYLADNVEDEDNSNIVLTPARANAIAVAIIAAAKAGTALTAAAINALIQAATGGAVSTLTGNTGTVLDVMRILAGEVYLVPAGAAISGAGSGGHAWAGTVRGSFIASGTSGYRGIRSMHATSALSLSVAAGNLSKVMSSSFLFNNPSETYGGSGTALFIDASHVPATYLGAAVRIYDAEGNAVT